MKCGKNNVLKWILTNLNHLKLKGGEINPASSLTTEVFHYNICRNLEMYDIISTLSDDINSVFSQSHAVTCRNSITDAVYFSKHRPRSDDVYRASCFCGRGFYSDWFTESIKSLFIILHRKWVITEESWSLQQDMRNKISTKWVIKYLQVWYHPRLWNLHLHINILQNIFIVYYR